MGMLSKKPIENGGSKSKPAAEETIVVTYELSQDRIVEYLTQALTKEGYSAVQVKFEYKDDMPDFILSAGVLNTTITGIDAGGSVESKVFNLAEVRELVATEIEADGHTIDHGSLSIQHYSQGKCVQGKVNLLLMRKVKVLVPKLR